MKRKAHNIVVGVGWVINFAPQSFFSRLIYIKNKFLYGSDALWTHSGIITTVNKKEDYVLIHEAIHRGFIVTKYSLAALEKLWLQGKISIGEPKEKLVYVKEYTRYFYGRPYSWIDIFNIIWYFLFGVYALRMFEGARYVICSEAVARILFYASDGKINLAKEYNKPLDYIEPIDIARSKYFIWHSKKQLPSK